MALPPNYLFVNPKDGRLVSRSYLQVPGGTSADPGISFIDSADSGFSCDASGVVSIISDGVQGVTVSSSAVNLISPVSLTGPLSFPLGTAAAPSLYPGTDTNTGIYSPGADQLAASTAGVERLRIDSAGQIEAGSLGTAAAPVWSFLADPNTGIYSPGADQVAISTNGTGRLFVDASGNIGIGGAYGLGSADRISINPTAGLIGFGGDGSEEYVTGEAGCYIYSGSGPTGTTLSGELILQSRSTVDRPITFVTGSTPTKRMEIAGNGNVGIGTTGPTAPLTIDSSTSNSSVAIFSAGTALDRGLKVSLFSDGGRDNAGVTLDAQNTAGTAGTLAFATRGTERARIDSSGRLLVGTSTSSLDGATLQVNGDFSQSSLYQQKVANFTGGDVSTKTLNIVTNNATSYDTSFVEVSCTFARGSSPRRYFYRALLAIEETGATVSGLIDELSDGVTATISFSGQTASLVLTFDLVIQRGAAFIKVVNSSNAQFIQSMSWS